MNIPCQLNLSERLELKMKGLSRIFSGSVTQVGYIISIRPGSQKGYMQYWSGKSSHVNLHSEFK